MKNILIIDQRNGLSLKKALDTFPEINVTLAINEKIAMNAIFHQDREIDVIIIEPLLALSFFFVF